MLDEFFSLVISENKSIRVEATRALANIFEYSNNSFYDFLHDKHLNLLVQLVNKYDINTTLQAIRCLGNVCHIGM